MVIPAADSNLLWIRSRGVCAYPECGAHLVVVDQQQVVTQGQRAHIRSATPDGPRYDESYARPDSYVNLLLLCRDHHNLIDSQPEAYPVALLEEWKRVHEGGVDGSTSSLLLAAPPPMSSRYVRREDLFADLQNRLADQQRLVLVGPSGSGKSQLAADFFRSAEHYSLRLWIRAGGETAVEDFSRAGRYLGLERSEEEPLAAYCARIREAFEGSPGWLLVFDSADEPNEVDGLIPRRGGDVILTSQAQAWALATLASPPLERSEADGILRRHEVLREASTEVVDQLISIAGNLPLCLAQVMSYLDATGMSPQELIDTFSERRADLLARGAPPDHLAIRVSISNALDRLAPHATDLLDALSLLAPVPIPIPVDLFPIEGSDLLAPLTDRVELEDALGELRRFSLIERDGGRLACHEIIQVLVRNMQSELSRRGALVRALTFVALLLPERADRPEHVPAVLALLPHARALVDHMDEHPGLGGFMANVMNRLATAYRLVGESDRGEADLTRALALLDRDDDANDALRGSILNNLSNCLADRGDYAGAIVMAREAVELKRRDPDAALSVSISLGALGCHLEAINELHAALAAHEEAMALLDPLGDVARLADAMNDNARVLLRMGRKDEARKLSERAAELAATDPLAWDELADAHLNLSGLAEEEEDVRGALFHASSAVQACEAWADSSLVLAKGLGTRGRLLGMLGDPQGAWDLRKASAMFLDLDGRGENYAFALGNLGSALLTLGLEAGQRPLMAEGLSHLRESLGVLQSILPADNPSVATAETMLDNAVELVWGGGQGQRL